MKIITVVSRALGNNTYIVISENGNAVVIDPSTDYEKIQNDCNGYGSHFNERKFCCM